MKIKNPNYRKFLDKGEIELITPEQLDQALSNVKGKYKSMGRALLITLFYTGARPNEILRLKESDFSKPVITGKERLNYIQIQILGSKRGLPRPIVLNIRNKHIKELWGYIKGCVPNMLVFYYYQNKYIRKVNTPFGVKERIEITDKLRYFIKKWFKDVIPESIPPYYLRHNCFSTLSSNGVAIEKMRQLKGARTSESVYSYLHLSKNDSMQVAKIISPSTKKAA